MSWKGEGEPGEEANGVRRVGGQHGEARGPEHGIGWHTIGVDSTSIGGACSVTGGFWGLPTAVQVVNAPTLTIVPAAPGNAMNLWTPNTPGFVLKEAWGSSPPNWSNTPTDSTNAVAMRAMLLRQFYRLLRQ
jgi:hypothetical protein